MAEVDFPAGFAAMGSEARLDVLRLLVRAGPEGLSVGALGARSGIAPSTLAHHLKVLAGAGLIVQEKQGRAVVSRADYGRLEALAGYILHNCCADVECGAPAREHTHV
ncbi:ArsR/SmtB family transcription factor [Poseidonocella sedimentorum]|uniref:DNA-binding transcriptional regulator, ArsR family n=1 Tax=Poseidonocella sedimentorum TaxID=871652 RepID=A0A1I6CNE6_9RHOB|nr:metalloregulator ArsR/SmtB family transcription factor [Poseidonocella sedimentorum]SFQ94666.1 DNA-binding transcriptional regulator, ArsR family [Poseidonocella sedimentorum]